eukprot:m.28307 g.28307  ORF g.28307 m.28307 type:complete len:508 (+) comp11826_c0_seq1:78-1601(+)
MGRVLSTVLFCALAVAAAATTTDKCEVCHRIVREVREGAKGTAKSIHFSGGNPEGWTKEKEKFLGKYSMNEARLVEILEGVCGRDFKCRSVLDDLEEHIEEFWKEMESDEDLQDLDQHLCYDEAKLCCPRGTYGKTCMPCPGGATSPCNNRGDCDGAGTRGGSGVCRCHPRATGKSCEACEAGAALDDAGQCVRCHASCKANCTAPGPAGCDECTEGYVMADHGCSDVDECSTGDGQCAPGTYCDNIPGSFSCEPCDVACMDGCSGPGAETCVNCAQGFERSEDSNACTDIDECKTGAPGCNPASEFCHNVPGGVECLPCHSSCTGCTDATESHCVDCAAGFEKSADGRCVDVNECEVGEGPCADAEDCVNTDGSFSCKCTHPNVLDNNKCRYDAQLWLADTVRPAPLPSEVDQPAHTSIEQGQVQVSPSETHRKAVKVSFPKQATLPTSIAVSGSPCCGDTFQYFTKDITETGFTLIAQRTDRRQGWGQTFDVEWSAYFDTKHEEL